MKFAGSTFLGDVTVCYIGEFDAPDFGTNWKGSFQLDKAWLENDKSETDILSMLVTSQTDRLEHDGYMKACEQDNRVAHF